VKYTGTIVITLTLPTYQYQIYKPLKSCSLWSP